jgi:branched-chain amino acid transport system permease protein
VSTPPQWAALLLALVGLGVLALARATGHLEWLDVANRVLVYGLAAASLDLLVGYGGMVSFGHATFLLCGGYAVGILSQEGVASVFVQWPVAVGAAALLAMGIGALSLRAGGVTFIMLTLAFSQMVYYVFVGLSRYGGDDGLQVFPRSAFPFGLDLDDPVSLYLTVLVTVTAGFFVLSRVVGAHLGLVLGGCRQNETRLRALGYPTFRYRLAAFVIGGALCGLAGALLANVSGFVSPALGGWERSGELLVMVIVGGQGTLFGPLLGAVMLIAVEDVVSEQTQHWPLLIGAVLVLVALFLPSGLRTLLGARAHD